MFENNLLAGVSGQGGAYSIDNSLRFNDDDSAYLSRTPSVAGDRKTWTWSGWVKLGIFGTNRGLWCAQTTAGVDQNRFLIWFNSSDKLIIYEDISSVANTYRITTQVFRDSSAWFHLVVAFDTSNATAADRIKIYVNGVEVTAFDTNNAPALNRDTFINAATSHSLGADRASSLVPFDGYLAEINFIDGQALTADDFGEINEDTGEWSPKKYSGTYGTNGFYLPFNGNANDSSGNGNNWTENNLASTDYMIDTPTNNFSVLNSVSSIGAISEGNLLLSTNATISWRTAISTIGVSSGKWYFEACLRSTDSPSRPYSFIGVTTNEDSGSIANFLGATADSWGYYQRSGDIFTNGSATAYSSISYIGDVIGVALDMDAGTLTFYINNVSQGVAVSGLTGTMFLGASVYTTSGTICAMDVNFGQDSSFAGLKTRQGNTDANGIGDFYYTPPTGYLALCTDNLPAPAIEQPETQFNVVTYTGDGTTPQAITGVGFQPDLVWIKRRDSAADNTVLDSIRGDARLETNNTDAEVGGNSNIFSSFDSDGFTIGLSSQVGASGGSYVAWCWKAGGTAVTNTDGAITSQVSANVDAGFSVATYTGNSSTGTIGHGLSKKPELVIIKNRNYSSGVPWYVGSPSFGTNNYLQLNSSSAMLNYVDGSGGAFFNYGGWSDSVVNVYNQNSTGINSSSYSYAMYSFHSVEGFSKIGSYTGNGSADGPFVYTGFKPAFVMFKRTDNTGSWLIYDNVRQGYNLENDYIYVNSANAEADGGSNGIDFLSNGIKLRNTYNDANTSGATYIYMAFAEHPFNYATGR